MTKNLVIVESPAKAKTIEGFLGKDFTVKSSFGHVRDLPTKGVAIEIEKDFEPQYVITSDKQKVVAELKKLAKGAEIVWLATDEDREGEAISWHLKEALKLKDDATRRITFNEITKTAVQNAIASPREIDIDLVNAQQARRVLDRLVGFELSPVLWKKVKPSLSAGRVQSVAVRLIVERERKIMDFQAESFFRVSAIFESNGKPFKAELNKRFKTAEETATYLDTCVSALYTVNKLEKKPGKKNPSAPFTTSTLQQEASRKLGFSVSQTMTLAQRLYEQGKITYMRTDSVNLSQTAVDGAKAAIIDMYGEEFSNPKQYTTKAKGAQEAHEAIRPTELNVSSVSMESGESRLYELIWKRTIASQMASAELEKTVVGISQSNDGIGFTATGEMLKFEGFLKVYLESTDDEDEEAPKGMLPKIDNGQELQVSQITGTERFTHHAPRYTEAALVKKLEELGIGRPSTYAPTISTIQKRGYVEKEEKEGVERKYAYMIMSDGSVAQETKTETTGYEKNKLSPTDIGIVVNDFLVQHFEKVLDYGFTAGVEREFDEIAEGKIKWSDMIGKFYNPFHKSVEDTLEHGDRASGERILGEDPKTGKPILVRIGRFGPMAQIGAADDEEKVFASLLKNQSIGTITVEEALELFKLPRKLGEYEEKVVTAAIGRFGPYIRHNSKFVSLKKDVDDPMTVTLERGIELIEEKRAAEKAAHIKSFDEAPNVTVLIGRWGPYIKYEKLNLKIPKGVVPEDLTLEDIEKIKEETAKNPPKRRKKK